MLLPIQINIVLLELVSSFFRTVPVTEYARNAYYILFKRGHHIPLTVKGKVVNHVIIYQDIASLSSFFFVDTLIIWSSFVTFQRHTKIEKNQTKAFNFEFLSTKYSGLSNTMNSVWRYFYIHAAVCWSQLFFKTWDLPFIISTFKGNVEKMNGKCFDLSFSFSKMR